jgi:hypothetical protein
MDVSKPKAAIAAAQASIKDVIDAEIKARSFNGLKALAGVDTALIKATKRLEDAVKRAAPREKKAKKA